MPPELSQPTPTFAPPQAVQGDPQGMMPQEGGLASDEQKQQLLDLISKIRSKVGAFNEASVSGTGQIDAQKQEILQQLFTALQEAGVDITDPESVNQFIEDLRARNPDLAQMFEEAIDGLLGEEPQEEPDGMPPMGMMG